ncbi:MAG: imelysin family protein [Balneolaceae bacterium]|nr:imelysin family protein [Balneolaceae bacterium]
MKNCLKLSAVVLLGGLMAVLSSCTNGGVDDPGSNFDRPAMLNNYGNNIIIPSYESLKSSVDDLDAAADAFSTEPTASNLSGLQNELKKARLAWQDASPFQFGPAEMNVLRAVLNTYPANTDQINSNIQSGSYNLETLENRAAAGFPTLGYLLHGVGDNNEQIVLQYTTEQNASNRMAYLQDNVDYVKETVDGTLNAWASNGGSYIDTFLSDDNAGTDVGSSLGMMVNALVLHYERFTRDGKIGIPAGVRSAGVPRPEATEAFYAGYSLELAIANLRAIKRLYLGTGLNTGDGLGLEENLISLDAAGLADQITTEIDQAIAALEELNDPLSQQIENNNDPVLTAFQELQDVVVLLKADMASALGVTITFQDNDGD